MKSFFISSSKLITYIVFLMITLSCNRRIEHVVDDKNLREIDVSLRAESDLFKEFHIRNLIYLDKDQMAIGNLDQVYFLKDSSFIVVDKTNETIAKFSRSGKLMFIFPKDYSRIKDTFFDSRKDVLEVFDLTERKMLSYDNNGVLLKTKYSNFDFLSFVKTAAGYWAYAPFSTNMESGLFAKSNNHCNLLLFDENLSVIKERFIVRPSFFDRNESFSNFHFDSDSIFYFMYGYDDVVYKIENNSVEAVSQFKFGENSLPYKSLMNIENRNVFDNKVFGERMPFKGFKTDVHFGKNMFSIESSDYKLGNGPEKINILIIPQENLRLNIPQTQGTFNFIKVLGINGDQLVLRAKIKTLKNEFQSVMLFLSRGGKNA